MSADRFARAVAFEHETTRRTSTHVERFAWGTVYLNGDLPHRFSSNLLWVDLGVSPPGVDELVGEADRVLGGRGLTHRMISVDGRTGERSPPDSSSSGGPSIACR
jgi:hypothetical protein